MPPTPDNQPGGTSNSTNAAGDKPDGPIPYHAPSSQFRSESQRIRMGSDGGDEDGGSGVASGKLDHRMSGALARRRSNFQGNQFPLATEAARKVAVAPIRNRSFNQSRPVNTNKPRGWAPSVQKNSANGGGFTLKVVPKQRSQTLDSLFSNMKEQRMRVLSRQNNAREEMEAASLWGLGSTNGIIKFVKYDEDVEDGNGQTAVRRLHGWMKIELGKFYYDLRDNGPVEARLLGNNFNTKVDIIVAGIELRMRVDTREFMRYDCVCSFKRKCEKLKKMDLFKPEGLWICMKNNKNKRLQTVCAGEFDTMN
ncbi:Uncharacterized protein Fot_12548 [Forsythia ovata]|uniref:Uncharacterized protein n=1 Tax=Forsythia ovata TaxID=205694 RepID=A0ABD1WQP8_9LAMI